MNKKKWNRCQICGRLIGLKEFDRNEIKIEYIFNEFTLSEDIEFIHKICEVKSNADL